MQAKAVWMKDCLSAGIQIAGGNFIRKTPSDWRDQAVPNDRFHLIMEQTLVLEEDRIIL